MHTIHMNVMMDTMASKKMYLCQFDATSMRLKVLRHIITFHINFHIPNCVIFPKKTKLYWTLFTSSTECLNCFVHKCMCVCVFFPLSLLFLHYDSIYVNILSVFFSTRLTHVFSVVRKCMLSHYWGSVILSHLSLRLIRLGKFVFLNMLAIFEIFQYIIVIKIFQLSLSFGLSIVYNSF